MSILPGLSNLGSASRPSRCFHLRLRGTGRTGKSQVTQGTTIMFTVNFLEEERVEQTSKVVREWEWLPDERPIPQILAFCEVRWRHRD